MVSLLMDTQLYSNMTIFSRHGNPYNESEKLSVIGVTVFLLQKITSGLKTSRVFVFAKRRPTVGTHSNSPKKTQISPPLPLLRRRSEFLLPDNYTLE